jgi:hypothetical protein
MINMELDNHILEQIILSMQAMIEMVQPPVAVGVRITKELLR